MIVYVIFIDYFFFKRLHLVTKLAGNEKEQIFVGFDKKLTSKNFWTGSTNIWRVSLCSSLRTLGYGKTCLPSICPLNIFITKE